VAATEIRGKVAKKLGDGLVALGENLRLVFWRWKYSDGAWSRVGTDFAVILPTKAIPAELISGIRTVRPPQRPALTVAATRQ
jgi:hypothetical protein